LLVLPNAIFINATPLTVHAARISRRDFIGYRAISRYTHRKHTTDYRFSYAISTPELILLLIFDI
jgi:hypothetical protein